MKAEIWRRRKVSYEDPSMIDVAMSFTGLVRVLIFPKSPLRKIFKFASHRLMSVPVTISCTFRDRKEDDLITMQA